MPSRAGWMTRGTLRRTSGVGVTTEGGTSGTTRSATHLDRAQLNCDFSGFRVQHEPGATRCNRLKAVNSLLRGHAKKNRSVAHGITRNWGIGAARRGGGRIRRGIQGGMGDDVRTKAGLKTKITERLPDNDTGLISPAILRQMLEDLIDSFASDVEPVALDENRVQRGERME